jgi:transposase
MVDTLTISEIATLFGVAESFVRSRISQGNARPEYFSISEVATRWRYSRGTVYNRLRSSGTKVLDFAPRGKKGKKAVPAAVIHEIELRKLRRLT